VLRCEQSWLVLEQGSFTQPKNKVTTERTIRVPAKPDQNQPQKAPSWFNDFTSIRGQLTSNSLLKDFNLHAQVPGEIQPGLIDFAPFAPWI